MIVQAENSTGEMTTLTPQELAEGLEGRSRTKIKTTNAKSRTRSKGSDKSALAKANEVSASNPGDTDNRREDVGSGGALATTEPGSTAMAHPTSQQRTSKKVKPVTPLEIKVDKGVADARTEHEALTQSGRNMAQAAVASIQSAYNEEFAAGMQQMVEEVVPQSYATATSILDDLTTQLYGDYLTDDNLLQEGKTDAIDQAN